MFDTATRTLQSPEGKSDTVCPHLAASLALLLASGTTVATVYRMGWSEIDLDIHLDRGPVPDQFAREHPLAAGVATWRNEDPHYGMDEGIVCKGCRQAIAWPHATS